MSSVLFVAQNILDENLQFEKDTKFFNKKVGKQIFLVDSVLYFDSVWLVTWDPELLCGPVQQQKIRPTKLIYGTLRYTLQAIRCCASYILLNRLGLGINSEFLCH